MYKVYFSKNAKEIYDKEQISLVKKINKDIEFLKTNPYKHNNIKLLSGKLIRLS